MSLTRRQAMAGALAAGAGALLPPAAAGASARPRVWSRWLGPIDGTTAPLRVSRFVLVGLQWSGQASARLEVRARLGPGRWSPWAPASDAGHDGDGAPRGGERFGEPVWIGAADTVQVRSTGRVQEVRLHFVTGPEARGEDAVAASPPLALPILDAGPGQPPIIARRAWAGDQAPPGRAPMYGTIDLAFVHHTVNPNGYGAAQVPAMLLAIFDYHRYVRGFFDIAYNFVIDAYGRIWEARAGGIDEPVIGAHAGGYNAESTGAAMLGTFSDVLPTPAALAALQSLLAWKLSLHGVPALGEVAVRVSPEGAVYTRFRPNQLVTLQRISGHRDGDLTDCPGNALYLRLPALRPEVASLAGEPRRLEMAASPTTAPPGTAVTLRGELAALDGMPVAGASVEVQQVLPGGATALAAATTDATGAFTATVTVQRNLLVRALDAAAPAAVSDPRLVGVTPALTLALVSARPLVVEGTVAPVRASVAIDVYGRRGRLLARRRAKVRDGRFRARLVIGTRPLVIVARVSAGGGTLAGRSAPLLLG